MRRFLELNMAGTGKKLYIPSDSILTYQEVLENENTHFPTAKTYIRYDYGEGLSYAILDNELEFLEEQIGTEGFTSVTMVEGNRVFFKSDMLLAISEDEDCTSVSVNMQGQVAKMQVKEPYEAVRQV